MYNKMLIAFDGSEGSMKALEHGIHLSRLLPNTRLTVAHVLKETNRNITGSEPHAFSRNGMLTPFGYAEGRENTNVITEKEPLEREVVEITATNDATLAEARTKIDEEGTTAEFAVLEGEPPKKLCEYANINEMDMIIIGSRGYSGIKKLMIGSVSQKVAQESDIPVLIVK
ncbi:universal stress protein [Sediminibacillus massiliensis]|uniref:universal stress protein n=1 Tax=Sediminibacillus massiliensis TaxID=1926277 RepID=UPI000988417A|nr:universal stress protein [Sediminibacillus massiliensis]